MQQSPIKSAARVLEVLELFAETRAPLRQNAIVARLAYPQSSTTGLLKSLVGLGYLNYHRASRTYFPTTRVAALGDWIGHFIFDQGKLVDMMRRIRDQTDETVALVSQNDVYIQYVRVLEPAHPLKYPPPEGAMRLLSQSSAGLVLMSRMTDRAVGRLVRHIDLRARGELPRIDLPALLDQLRRVRDQGHAFLAGIPIPQAATLSMPLPDGPHGLPLVIGVGGEAGRITRDRARIVAIMRAAVDAYRAEVEPPGPTPQEDAMGAI